MSKHTYLPPEPPGPPHIPDPIEPPGNDNPVASFALNRSFLMMSYDQDAANRTYLTKSDAATKAVQSLGRMGVKYFLLPPGTQDEIRVIATAIAAAGLQFYSNERWPFEAAVDHGGGHFDSTSYVQSRVNRELLPLKQEFPSAFIGFQFKDEPGLAHFDNLGELKACLSSQPEFQGMKVFLNLFPIHTKYASLSGLLPDLPLGLQTDLNSRTGGSRPPSDFGVDCSSDSIFDAGLVMQMTRGYGTYARMAVEKIRPDYLSFDLYPIAGDLRNCRAGRELTMSENFNYISVNARNAGVVPVAYLQNFRPRGSQDYANFHHLRWFAGWALAFGIRDFANFLSHDDH